MLNAEFNKETFKNSVKENVKMLYRKNLEEASQQEIYQAVCYAVKDVIIDNWLKTQKAMDEQDPKILYYMSMEFLMGRALGNNLINLTAYKQVQEALDEMGLNLNLLEDQERDPALGNGGLGRLAACFLDSLATLGYPAYGCGIRYKYGMFKQQIRDGYQVEVPDNWLKHGYPFELKRPEYAKEVKFGGYVAQEYDETTGRVNFVQKDYQSVNAIPYDMPIVGYDNDVVNTLTIWDAEAIQDFSLDSFDKGDYHKAVEQENLAKTIVEVLYPNDNHYEGKELRLKQQYFFISASVQRAVAKYKKHHDDIIKLYEKVTFQLNDTHPTVAVPELMRILMDVEGLGWDEAWEITTKTCAYTNHTIMAEALEKWPIELFSRLLPRIYQIIEEINRRFVEEIQKKYPGNQEKIRKMAIIYDGQVKMAHLAICAGYSVNGVAALHTEILKNQELKDFYKMMPEKFNNKTNGITQRRFLLHANPLLADWVTEHIGDEWITDLAQISKLKVYVDDEKAQQEFMNIKYQNKLRLAKYIREHNGIDVTGIIRAGVKGVASGFHFSEGASTITQQLLKNTVFTSWTSESSMADKFERKFQEQYLALQLEKVVDKDWILENYLNAINLGQNTLGVGVASERYFGKDVSDLTLSECAVLAAITQNPSKYNPITNPQENSKRRMKVLNNMKDQGYISQEEYDEAVADNVYDRIQLVNIESETNSINSYFVDELTDQVIQDLVEQKGYTETQAYKALYQGGLTIYSTQDPEIQAICDDEVNNLDNYPTAPKVSFSYRLSVRSEGILLLPRIDPIPGRHHLKLQPADDAFLLSVFQQEFFDQL